MNSHRATQGEVHSVPSTGPSVPVELGWATLPVCGSAQSPVLSLQPPPLPGGRGWGCRLQASALAGLLTSDQPCPEPTYTRLSGKTCVTVRWENARGLGALSQDRGTETNKHISIYCSTEQIILLHNDLLRRHKDILMLTYRIFDIVVCFFCVYILRGKNTSSSDACYRGLKQCTC